MGRDFYVILNKVIFHLLMLLIALTMGGCALIFYSTSLFVIFVTLGVVVIIYAYVRRGIRKNVIANILDEVSGMLLADETIFKPQVTVKYWGEFFDYCYENIYYLGWLPQIGGPSDSSSIIILTNKRLFYYEVFGKRRNFSIAYKDMTSVSIETKESISARRVVLLGPLLGALYKTKKPFLLIGVKNEINESHHAVFDANQPQLEELCRVISEYRIQSLKA